MSLLWASNALFRGRQEQEAPRALRPAHADLAHTRGGGEDSSSDDALAEPQGAVVKAEPQVDDDAGAAPEESRRSLAVMVFRRGLELSGHLFSSRGEVRAASPRGGPLMVFVLFRKSPTGRRDVAPLRFRGAFVD